MPEFMNNLRKACLELRKWKRAEEESGLGGEEAESQSRAARESEPSYMSTETTNNGAAAAAKSSKERQNDTDLLNSNAKLSH